MKKNRPFITMGLTLLTAVLLALLLVSFSLLSLSTARSDHARSTELARRGQEYYSACNQAEAAIHALRLGDTPAPDITREEGTLSFQIPISDGQSLLVTLEQSTLEILRWQTTNSLPCVKGGGTATP